MILIQLTVKQAFLTVFRKYSQTSIWMETVESVQIISKMALINHTFSVSQNQSILLAKTIQLILFDFDFFPIFFHFFSAGQLSCSCFRLSLRRLRNEEVARLKKKLLLTSLFVVILKLFFSFGCDFHSVVSYLTFSSRTF